jgi:hypothetical protein
MVIPVKVKKYLPLLVAALFFLSSGALGVFFLFRPPILIVTDASFLQLYGSRHLKQENRRAELKLFRQLIPVIVDEGAGPDLVASAAEDAFRLPWAVFFPYRYLEGARLYKEKNPDVPVLVAGRPASKEAGDSVITFVAADAKADLYRAGLCAALLAGEKKVLIFDAGLFPDEYRESFREELITRGFFEEPVFQRPSTNYPSYPEIGCIIATGPAAGFMEQDLEIPVILFSWTDPAITPRTVKIVFDDSPWVLAAEVFKFFSFSGSEKVRLLSNSDEILIPSKPLLIRGRLGEKAVFRKLRHLLKENFSKN